MAKKLVRLTESELGNIITRATHRILSENREIKLAQKELHSMGSAMSSVCLRLQGSRYEPLADKMRASVIELNDKLVKDIRGESE